MLIESFFENFKNFSIFFLSPESFLFPVDDFLFSPEQYL